MLDKIDIVLDGVEIYHKRITEDITSLIENATKEDIEAIAEVKSDSRRAEILTTRALIRNTFGENVSLSHNADGSPKEVFSQVELLHSIGLAAPETVELLHQLNSEGAGLPVDRLDIEECAQTLYEELKV